MGKYLLDFLGMINKLWVKLVFLVILFTCFFFFNFILVFKLFCTYYIISLFYSFILSRHFLVEL